jgi:O-methyltransferase
MAGLMADLRPRIGKSINLILGRFGWQLIRRTPRPDPVLPSDFDGETIPIILAASPNTMTSPERDQLLPSDFDDETIAIIRDVSPYTMTSPERIGALVNALRYVSNFQIPGAIVECGVWRGGSMMVTARSLQATKDYRDLYLFDTFDGMTAPTDIDIDPSGRPAREILAGEDRATSQVWAYAPFEDVRANMRSTGYPSDLIHYVKGPVEQTVPDRAPEKIAVLRLDTDFYESTRHELEHLIARVSQNGVLIVDDYGHWEGARRAVDEWLGGLERPVMLNRIDYTGRIAVLP